MIPYINTVLNRWADWVASGRRVGGLSYPSRSAFMRLTPSEGHEVVFDEESSIVDRCVVALRVEHPGLHRVVELFHLRHSSMTVAQMARECGCSRDTFYVRVDQSHHKVHGYMQDVELGLVLPSPAIVRAA